MVSPQPPDSRPLPRLIVVRADRGWEVHEESDRGVVRVSRHMDWHRVERSIQRFEARMVGTRPFREGNLRPSV